MEHPLLDDDCLLLLLARVMASSTGQRELRTCAFMQEGTYYCASHEPVPVGIVLTTFKVDF
jgi:hypothetical protein